MPSAPRLPVALIASFALVMALGTFSAQAAQKHACRAGEPAFWRDQALTMKVTTKLQFNKALLREKINAKVTGGVAMLWGGMASNEAIATAVKVASEVEGISCVDNQLKVGPPE